MTQILDEEKKYLEYVEKVIEKEIGSNSDSETSLKKQATSLSFEDRLRGTHFHLNSQLYNVGETIQRLERAIKSPYFGRIDYQQQTQTAPHKIYIGRSAISNNSDLVVYDWRSPICSLYYDSELGPVTYSSPVGKQEGNLLLKRQLLIKDGKLLNAVDSNLVSEDELLLPYLNVNADDRMKTIIASIQKEQNAIIRADNKNLIVQGVAGSGKTSVALHRIAYQIYLLGDKARANQFLVIGPNEYFLNYVSSVLPELETTPVTQKTLLELMREYTELDLTLDSQVTFKKGQEELQKQISSFKSSNEYYRLLEDFMQECINGIGLVEEDFKIDGKIVFSKEEIRQRLMGAEGKNFDFKNMYKFYKSLFKETKDDIYEQLNEEYRKKYISLPKGDPKRKQYIAQSEELRKLIKEQGEKLLDKYFKQINKNCLSLYVSFIASLDEKHTSLTIDGIHQLQKDTLKAIRKKHILFEDIPALLYIKYRLTNKKLNYSNVIIDEAQDYSPFTFYVLKQVFPNAKFNIYGDIAQAIYPYRSISSWEELNDSVFENDCTLLELSKSYRTTIEITETANSVLETLGLNPAQPVIRHGVNVVYEDTSDNNDIKVKKINEWVETGYKTIAVICKDDNEAQKVQEELANSEINSKYISNKDKEYEAGVFVLSVASAKGLEFDCTIINDASSNIYNAESDVDMHLLYVASTRALHEQLVLYNKNITIPYRDKIQPKKVLKKSEQNT